MQTLEQRPHAIADILTTDSLPLRESRLVKKRENIVYNNQDEKNRKKFQPQIDALNQLGYSKNDAIDLILFSLRLFDNTTTKREKGSRIYHEGDPAESVVLLKSGHALVYNSERYGKRNIIEIADSPMFLGDEILHEIQRREYTIEALTNCSFQTVQKEKFAEQLKQEPKLATLLFVTQSIKKHRLENRMLDLMSKKALLRVASAFSEFIKIPGISPQQITYQLIADYSGCSRETVTREMARLKDAQILQWVSGIGPQINDESALKALTD